MPYQDYCGEFYIIQHQQSDGDWAESSHDSFGTPPTFNHRPALWSQYACVDHDLAIDGLAWMMKKHKDRTFRIIRVSLCVNYFPA